MSEKSKEFLLNASMGGSGVRFLLEKCNKQDYETIEHLLDQFEQSKLKAVEMPSDAYCKCQDPLHKPISETDFECVNCGKELREKSCTDLEWSLYKQVVELQSKLKAVEEELKAEHKRGFDGGVEYLRKLIDKN